MNHLYKRTFDQVHMSEKTAETLRAELASRSAYFETEENPMNKHHMFRRSTTFLIAAILIASMTITALACGGYVVYQIISEGDIPEDSVFHELTDLNADVEFHDYEYTEENGEIHVNLGEAIGGGTGASNDVVTYQFESGSDITEDMEFHDLTDQSADLEIQNYSYTEENGEIHVDLDGTN